MAIAALHNDADIGVWFIWIKSEMVRRTTIFDGPNG